MGRAPAHRHDPPRTRRSGRRDGLFRGERSRAPFSTPLATSRRSPLGAAGGREILESGDVTLAPRHGQAQQAAAAFVEANLPELFARMIPAITGPAGSRELSRIEELRNSGDYKGRNFNLEDHQTAPWPRPAAPDESPPWRHRDHRRVAYVYVFDLYDKIAAQDVLGLKWRLEP